MQASLVAESAGISDLLARGTDLLKAHKIDVPQLEAEYLLAARLSCDRLKLFLDAEKEVSESCREGFFQDISRRARHEPLQYIIGDVEFYGLSFSVSAGVFIPRPETELIVEAVLNLSPPPRKILDLCTGSGVLAVTLAASLPSATLIATDISEQALKTAKLNAKKNACASQIAFLKGDLFEPIKREKVAATPFDLIVSNPPYISEAARDSLPPEVRDFEPEIALFAEDEGRAFYRRILAEAPASLSDTGMILLEMGFDQSEWLRHFIEDEINTSSQKLELSFISDWSGIERIARISFRKNPLKETQNG